MMASTTMKNKVIIISKMKTKTMTKMKMKKCMKSAISDKEKRES